MLELMIRIEETEKKLKEREERMFRLSGFGNSWRG
jgi:hypothetical protein